MWTLLKPFIEERETHYRIDAVRAMINWQRAVFRDYFLHTFYFINSGLSWIKSLYLCFTHPQSSPVIFDILLKE